MSFIVHALYMAYSIKTQFSGMFLTMPACKIQAMSGHEDLLGSDRQQVQETVARPTDRPEGSNEMVGVLIRYKADANIANS